MANEHDQALNPNRVVSVLPVIIGLGLLFLLSLRWISDGAFWTHLVTGRWISDHGIPRTDSLSLTADGTKWVAPNWLYSIILYRMWKYGPGLTIVAHAGIIVLSYAFLIPVARRWANKTAMGCALLLSAWLSAPVLDPGPHVMALLFPSLFILLLHKNRPSAVTGCSILILQIIWTNFHASFILGPMICFLFAFSHPEPGRDVTSPMRRYLTPSLLVLATGTLLVTMINPYGVGLHIHVVSAAMDPASRYISNWISPFSAQFGSTLSKHLTTLALAIGAGGLMTYKQKLPFALTSLAILGALLTVFIPNHTGDLPRIPPFQTFALLAFPFFCLSLHSIGNAIVDIACRIVSSAKQSTGLIASTSVLGLGIVSLGLAFSNQYYRRVGSASAFGLKVNDEVFPIEAFDLIHHPKFPKRCVNLAFDGGYLSWAHPERKIFLDQRPGLFDAAIHQLVFDALRGDEEQWESLLTTWKPNAFILNMTNPTIGTAVTKLASSDQWRLAYFDGTTMIFIRNLPDFALVIENPGMQRYGLKVLDSMREQIARRTSNPLKARFSARLYGAARGFYDLRRFPEAAAAYELLLLNAPRFLTGWFPYGVCQLHGRQINEAITTLEKACEYMPNKSLAWFWLGQAYQAAGRTDEAERALSQAKQLRSE